MTYGTSALPDVVKAPIVFKQIGHVRRGSDLYRVLAALHELAGVPMSSTELADETGLPLKQCSGYMYTLRKLGLAHSRPANSRLGGRGTRSEHWVGELLA